MTMRDFNSVFKPSLVALACLFLASAAKADSPLSLTVSENLTRDSNVLRNNDNKYSDTVSVTGAQLGFNKQYGRQTYRASGTVLATRYKTTDFYDNDGYNLALGFTSQVASNWLVSLDHNRVSQLQSFQDQGLNRYREPIKSQDTGLFVQYGLYGRWSVNTDLSVSKVDYEVLRNNNRKSEGAKFGVRYSPTDLLYFDVGYRHTDSRLPNYAPSVASDYDGEKIKRQSIEFSTRWVVTGYSNLDARVAWTRERYRVDEMRDFNGLTGNLGWTYSPSSKISYGVNLSRDTNNEGGSTVVSFDGFTPDFLPQFSYGFNSQKRVTTGLSVRANYSATAKISLSASASYRRIEEERRYDPLDGSSTGAFSDRSTGSYRSVNLGVAYQVFRSTRLGCSVEKYARSASIFSRDFSGDAVSCNAAFTID